MCLLYFSCLPLLETGTRTPPNSYTPQEPRKIKFFHTSSFPKRQPPHPCTTCTLSSLSAIGDTTPIKHRTGYSLSVIADTLRCAIVESEWWLARYLSVFFALPTFSLFPLSYPVSFPLSISVIPSVLYLFRNIFQIINNGTNNL